MEQALSCFRQYIAALGEPAGDAVLPLDEERLEALLARQADEARLQAARAEHHPRKVGPDAGCTAGCGVSCTGGSDCRCPALPSHTDLCGQGGGVDGCSFLGLPQ